MTAPPSPPAAATESREPAERRAAGLLDSLPTRVLYSAQDEDELTRTLMGHDSHFLQRTARFGGAELDRAMRLYHHSAVVKRLVSEALKDDPQQDRCAVALSDAPPSGHVILSRRGFVTCLTAQMRIGGLPVLPFRSFAEAMDAADSQIEFAALRRRQLAQLDPQELIAALVRGPGHITREMAEVIALAPGTYVVPVHFAFQFAANNYARIVETLYRLDGVRRKLSRDPKFPASRKALLRHRETAVATCRLCLYLLGSMDEPMVTELLCRLAPHYTDFTGEGLFALARHKLGYKELFQVARNEEVEVDVRRMCVEMMTQHVVLYPTNLPGILREMLEEKDPAKAHLVEKILPLMEEISKLFPEQRAVDKADAPAEQQVQPQLDVIGWPHSAELQREVNLLRQPVSLLFPPADLKQQAEASFRQYLRDPPDEEAPLPVPVVRTEPRVGRNDPCPCGSGRKHKRCCGAQA